MLMSKHLMGRYTVEMFPRIPARFDWSLTPDAEVGLELKISQASDKSTGQKSHSSAEEAIFAESGRAARLIHVRPAGRIRKKAARYGIL
jgi:hypothetical protein